MPVVGAAEEGGGSCASPRAGVFAENKTSTGDVDMADPDAEPTLGGAERTESGRKEAAILLPGETAARKGEAIFALSAPATSEEEKCHLRQYLHQVNVLQSRGVGEAAGGMRIAGAYFFRILPRILHCSIKYSCCRRGKVRLSYETYLTVLSKVAFSITILSLSLSGSDIHNHIIYYDLSFPPLLEAQKKFRLHDQTRKRRGRGDRGRVFGNASEARGQAESDL